MSEETTVTVSARTGWLLLVVGTSVVAIVAALAGTGNGWSFLPLLGFLAVIPGLPYVRMARLGGGPLTLWVAAVALSLAIDAVVAEVLLYTGTYGAVRVVVVLAGVACVGAIIGRRRRAWDAPEPAETEAVSAAG